MLLSHRALAVLLLLLCALSFACNRGEPSPQQLSAPSNREDGRSAGGEEGKFGGSEHEKMAVEESEAPSGDAKPADRAAADPSPAAPPAEPAAVAPSPADGYVASGEAKADEGGLGVGRGAGGMGMRGVGVGGGGTGEGSLGLGGIGSAGKGGGKDSGARGPGASLAERAEPAKVAMADGDDKIARDIPAPKPDGAKRKIERDEEKPVPRKQAPQSGQLTAGEWKDVDHWDFWRELFDGGQNGQQGEWQRMEPYWGYYSGQAIPVRVTTQGRGVADAKVVLRDGQQRVIWQARTNNKGSAVLFPALFSQQKPQGPFTVAVDSGGNTGEVANVRPTRGQTVEVALTQAAPTPTGLDVMFVVDTTGSMGDELEYLKSELGDVVRRVQNTHGQQLSIRTSVNFYRDQGDEYVVRAFPFEQDMSKVQGQLDPQYASGGGDFPEAVEEGLSDAVFKHEWRANARARLLFLVLDAPPHSRPEVQASLHEATQEAARQGIQIIPIVASGIDKPTEFLMRFLSVSTHGSYVFLTDDSGIGGGHIKPTIGPHKVEQLNALLTKIINRSLEEG